MRLCSRESLLILVPMGLFALIVGAIINIFTIREEMENLFKRSCYPGMVLDKQMNPVTEEQSNSDGLFIGVRTYMLLCTDGERKWVKEVEWRR